MSLAASHAVASHGMTCCSLMRDALASTRDADRPRGLRRRAMVDEAGGVEILVLYTLGKRDALCAFCPFCGTRLPTSAATQGIGPETHGPEGMFLDGISEAAVSLDQAASEPMQKSPETIAWCANLLRSYVKRDMWADRKPPPLVRWLSRVRPEPK